MHRDDPPSDKSGMSGKSLDSVGSPDSGISLL
jgi:hypothetical protein